MKTLYNKSIETLLNEGVSKFEGDDGRFYYVYSINFSNGNYYIGKHSTKNFDDGYCGSGVLLNREFLREKNEAIKYIIGFYRNGKELSEAEELYLGNKYKTDEKCLNFVKGGKGGFSELMVSRSIAARKKKGITDETRKKMSDSQKGRKHSKETKDKISNWHKNMFLTEAGDEKKEKIANAQRGRVKSKEEIKKLSESHKKLMQERGRGYWTKEGYDKMIESLANAKPHVWTDDERRKASERSKKWANEHKITHTEEERKKIRAALKGRKTSKEEIEHNRLAHIGLKASDETKKKMSEARSGRKNPRYIDNEIEMYDLEWNLMGVFSDAIEASDYIVRNVNKKANTSEIFIACRTGKTRYGHKWKMKERH